MPGWAECDNDLTVTCETNLNTTAANCGFCGNVCTTANGIPQCASGMCQVGSCNTGYDDCDRVPSNGCEEPLTSSVAHCGSCATACTNAHGTTSCMASTCVPSCSTGFADCDGDPKNGCETALDTVSDCGMCGKTCPANGGTPICTAGVCNTICDLSGTLAVKLSVTANWAARTYVSAGTGPLVAWFLLQGTQTGNNLVATLSACGRTDPGFQSSVLSENYGFAYPNTLFDHVPIYLPTSAVTVALSNPSPGATLTLPASAVVMGVSMADPINGSWPSAASLTAVDMDMNTKAGVTVAYKNTGGFSYAPVNIFRTARADSAYIASRFGFALNGTLTSCTQASGPATVSHADIHILGCKHSGSSTDCSASETSFLDTNHPQYTLGAASYTLTKIAAAGTCADVRAALP
jgi:hypothetical protein